MKKKKDKTNNPFSDIVAGSYFGWIEPGKDDLTFEQHIEGYRKSTTLGSEKLRVLVSCYERGTFEKAIDDLLESGYLSLEERSILIDAWKAGSEINRDNFQRDPIYFLRLFKAVSYLVRANPDSIKFPFVQRALSNLIRLYWDVPPSNYILSNIRIIWNSFLPSRQGGNIPYRENDLQRLLDIAIKQGYTKAKAIEIMSNKLNISEEKLRILRVKDKKGRPKKPTRKMGMVF